MCWCPFFWWNEILIAVMCTIVYDIMNLSGKGGYEPHLSKQFTTTFLESNQSSSSIKTPFESQYYVTTILYYCSNAVQWTLWENSSLTTSGYYHSFGYQEGYILKYLELNSETLKCNPLLTFLTFESNNYMFFKPEV